MPRIGRPPKPFRAVQWSFHLPEGLAAKYDLLLTHANAAKPIMPGVRQELFIPLLERLWEALQTGSDTIYVGDVVAQLQSRIVPLESPDDQTPQS